MKIKFAHNGETVATQQVKGIVYSAVNRVFYGHYALIGFLFSQCIKYFGKTFAVNQLNILPKPFMRCGLMEGASRTLNCYFHSLYFTALHSDWKVDLFCTYAIIYICPGS